MQRHTGMLPAAFGAYLKACAAAGLEPESVVQTVGQAPLSAGYHAADGTFRNERGREEEYSAATDLSVRHPRELSGGEVSRLLLALLRQGYCPFWRHEGVFMEGPHIHMVWPACAMKPALRGQVRDFLYARNGLAGHAPDTFWIHFIHQEAWETATARIRTAFAQHNG